MPAQPLYKHTTARHGRMIVFANDTGAVTSSLLRYGEWAEQEISFMTALFDEGATVLDIGAYIGTHTLAFSRKAGANGRVIAFEPQPASFRVLERNVALNGLANVELHEAAVADRHGATRFEPTDPAEKSSFGSAVLNEQGDAAHDRDAPEVRTVSLDDLALTRCDLIKIDVEGMERSVLDGARALIERHRPWLYAECNSVAAGLETCQVLRSHGYDVKLHLTNAFNPANFCGEATNIFDQAREAALVGMPPGSGGLPDALLAAGGPLLTIETADDLVLGMLNKPQYVGEVLQGSAAAASGGSSWITEHAALREQRTEMLDALERSKEIGRLSAQLGRTQDALEETQALALNRYEEIKSLETMVEATIRQADAARQEALAPAGPAHGTERLAARFARSPKASEETGPWSRDGEVEALRSMVEATLHQAAVARALHRQEIGEALARTQADAARLSEALAQVARSETVSSLRTNEHAERLSAQLARTQEALEETQALAVDRYQTIKELEAMVEATLAQAEIARALRRQEIGEATAGPQAHIVQLREKEAEADRQIAEAREVRAHLEALMASTSWRITRPMRVLGRLLRKR